MKRPDIPPNIALMVAAVFSGAATLAYEIVWTRAFALILGSTVQAASATFAAFLVGLAVGAFVLGRYADRLERIVRVLVLIEVGIAISGPSIGFLIHYQRDFFTELLHAPWAPRGLVAFVTVLLLVILPTALMGATFPLLLAAGRRVLGTIRAIPQIYGYSIFGAAVGTYLSGFVLLRLFGLPMTLGLAALLNLVAAAACVPLAFMPKATEGDGTGDAASGGAAANDPQTSGRHPEWLLWCVAFTSGAMILALEVVWSRFASFYLGNRTYAFTTLLACILILLAVGSWLSERVWERFSDRGPIIFGWAVVIGTAATVLSTAAAAWWIVNQQRIEAGWPNVEHVTLLYRVLETAALLAPPMLTLGCLFPLSIACSKHAGDRTGHAAGLFYLVNASGAVAGSLLVGFVGLSTIGVYGCVRVVVVVGSALALAIFAWCYRRADAGDKAQSASGMGMVAATAVAVLVFVALPSQLTLLEPGEELLARKEDANGVFQVLRTADGTIKVKNNRTALIGNLGRPQVSFVQEMQGHLGILLNPRAKTAAVIGSGYGITAGTLSLYSQIERIDAVEILPGMVEAADLFVPYNRHYHRAPNVRVVVDDGRHFLALSEDRYDIITIDVSDPHLPGEASLFHADFYELAKKRLTAGGLLIQHVFGSDVPLQVRTLAHSFSELVLFRSYGNGYNVVAADYPIEVEREQVERLIAEPQVGAALRAIGIIEPLSLPLVLEQGVTLAHLPLVFRQGPIATDDHPRLEFSWDDSGVLLLFSNQ